MTIVFTLFSLFYFSRTNTQVHGADVPLYERSQLSTTAIFHTLPPNHAVGSSGSSTSVVVRDSGGVDGSGGKGVNKSVRKSTAVNNNTITTNNTINTTINNTTTSGVSGKHTKAIATSKSMNSISSKSNTNINNNTSTALTITDNTNNNTNNNITSSNNNTDTNSTTTTNTTTSMSRTKKEIFSAVLQGQQLIQIERLNNYCQSHGVSDNYM